MAYDSNRAAPSPEAHAAAAAADTIIESLLDGFQITDAIVAFGAAPQFAARGCCGARMLLGSRDQRTTSVNFSAGR